MIVRIEYVGGPWDGARTEHPAPAARDLRDTFTDSDGRRWKYQYRSTGRFAAGSDDGVTRRLYELVAAWPADTTHPSAQTGDSQ